MVVGIAIAILITEVRNTKLKKIYQSAILPPFLIEQTEIGIENSSDAEKQQGDDGRNEARQCDFCDLLPFACAVQSGSLIEGRIDTDQGCDVDQASVSYALPAVRDNQDRRPVFRFLIPLNRVNVEQRKDRVVDKTIFCTQKRIYDVA